MSSDMVTSVPWACYEKDCASGWHLGGYWVHTDHAACSKTRSRDNWTYDSFGDGDHIEISLEDFPSTEEHDKAWLAYWKSVAATGNDSLGQLIGGAPTYLQKQRWTFEISLGIGGLQIRRARRGRGDWITFRQLPKQIAEYMLLNRHGRIEHPDWNSVSDMAKGCTELTFTSMRTSCGRFTGTLEVVVPREPSVVKKETQTKARRQVRASLKDLEEQKCLTH